MKKRNPADLSRKPPFSGQFLKDTPDTPEGSAVEPLNRAGVGVTVRTGVFLVASVVVLHTRNIVANTGKPVLRLPSKHHQADGGLALVGFLLHEHGSPLWVVEHAHILASRRASRRTRPTKRAALWLPLLLSFAFRQPAPSSRHPLPGGSSLV